MARKLDKRLRPNPRLRIAALISALLVLVAMVQTASSSLTHTEVVRPQISASAVPGTIGLSVAASDAAYISAEEQRAAVRRIARSGRPLFCGGTKNYAAITIDDGPSATTPELIAALSEASVPVTWFSLGENAEERPEGLKAQAEYGPVGNHGWDHTSLAHLSQKDFKKQVGDTQKVITELTGQDHKILRPPYGARSPASEKLTKKLGFADILWSADSQDGLSKPADVIAKNSLDGLGPGAILLLHDGTNPATLEALKTKVLPELKRRNITLVSIPDLLVLNPPSSEQLRAGPWGCSHTSRSNVSGSYLPTPERY